MAGISGDPEDTEKHPWDMFELSMSIPIIC